VTIGLDLGDHGAYAVLLGDQLIACDSMEFGLSKHNLKGDRWVNYLQWIEPFIGDYVERYRRVTVGYERPFFQGKAAEILHGFETVIQMGSAYHHIEPQPVNPMTLKKWASGSGLSKKPAMARALLTKHPGLFARIGSPVQAVNDNIVDAVWVALYTRESYSTPF